MEDNKEKETLSGQENKPEGQTLPAPQPKPVEPVVPVQPTPAQQEVKKVEPAVGPTPVDFGATGMDDINKNLGSFGKTAVEPAAPTPDLKLDVDSKVIEKASKEEINFERFSKTKKEHKRVESAPRTRFGERISMLLRNKKGLRTTWILELVIMVIVIGVCAGLIVWLSPYLKTNTIKTLCGGVTQAGVVFLWIAMFPCLIPLIYLVTAWFIGINQVASSRTFHIFFWITEIFALFCFVLGICLCAKAMHYIAINPAIKSIIESVL